MCSGPAGWESLRPTACCADEPARDLEELAAAGRCGLHRAVRVSDQAGPVGQVVREGGDHVPGAVGVVVAGREVRQGLGLEVADHLFDLSMTAMINVGGQ